LAARIIHSLAF